MIADALFDQQKDWAEQTLFLLRELLPLVSPVGRYSGWTGEEGYTVGALASACARSSESVVLLCAYGQLWDADVISRSVCEGTLKMMYLLQSKDTFQKRHDEYANDLFDIALLKDHKKANDLLVAVPDPAAARWKPIRDRLLSPEQITKIEQRLEKQVRRALEAKWGFSGLIGELSRSGDPMFSNISALCHGYSMSSHVMHADYIGVSISLERDMRPEERRDSIHLSHLVSLLLAQLAYLQMRIMVGYRFVGHPLNTLAEMECKIQALKECFGDVYGRWLDCEYGNDLHAPPN